MLILQAGVNPNWSKWFFKVDGKKVYCWQSVRRRKILELYDRWLLQKIYCTGPDWEGAAGKSIVMSVGQEGRNNKFWKKDVGLATGLITIYPFWLNEPDTKKKFYLQWYKTEKGSESSHWKSCNHRIWKHWLVCGNIVSRQTIYSLNVDTESHCKYFQYLSAILWQVSWNDGNSVGGLKNAIWYDEGLEECSYSMWCVAIATEKHKWISNLTFPVPHGTH